MPLQRDSAVTVHCAAVAVARPMRYTRRSPAVLAAGLGCFVECCVGRRRAGPLRSQI